MNTAINDSDFDDVAAPGHLPVMPTSCVAALQVVPGQVVVDCTAGGGGHLRLFANAVGPTGRVIGLDRDARAFADDAAGGVAASMKQVRLLRHPFSAIETALREEGVEQVDAVFADLGVSSFQLDEGERGFSFRFDAPLDMRMDRRDGETAAELIARLDEEALANVIYRYGDEHRSRRIARVLKERLPETTAGLKDAVFRACGPDRGRIHPATKTFQALRIAVNGELDELSALLDALPRILRLGGHAGFLTFHSLEDRLVKLAFKDGPFTVTSKKPIVADDEELAGNPRARSAKLRVASHGRSVAVDRKARYAKLAAEARRARGEVIDDDDDDDNNDNNGDDERDDDEVTS